MPTKPVDGVTDTMDTSGIGVLGEGVIDADNDVLAVALCDAGADTEIELVVLNDANFDGDADSDIVREALNAEVTVVDAVDVTEHVSDNEGEVLARRREETDDETLVVAVTLVVCDIVLVQLGDSEFDAVTVTVSVLEEELLVVSLTLELAVIDCDEELSALGSIEADADGVVDGVSDTVGDDVGVLVAVAVFDVDGDGDAVNDTVLAAVDVAVSVMETDWPVTDADAVIDGDMLGLNETVNDIVGVSDSDAELDTDFVDDRLDTAVGVVE